MVEEVLYYLQLRQGYTIVDCTVGSGGHATKIIDKIKPDGLLIGIDKDMEILQIAKQNLSDTGGTFRLYHANYLDIDEVLRQAGINKVNGVLLDLGVSSMQLDRADRGRVASHLGHERRLGRIRGRLPEIRRRTIRGGGHRRGRPVVLGHGGCGFVFVLHARSHAVDSRAGF